VRSGEAEVTMTYGEYDAEKAFELIRWLGPGAELLEPAEWRERFRDEIDRMRARYA
jgi:predicted DNA-binding transcriptional regulator YafY